jgi:hypothetical protein
MLMRRVKDTITGDLFMVPTPVGNVPGSLACRVEIAHCMSDALIGHDRYEVATQISRLTGREISKHMLDAYTAESRETHIPPIDIAIAFDLATGGVAMLNLYAAKLGARVLIGKESLDAEIGKLERLKEDASKKIRELKRVMGETE